MWDRPSCAVFPALNYDLLFFSLCHFSRSAFCHFYLTCSCFNPLPSVGETLSSWLEMFEGRFHEPPDPSNIGLDHHPFNGISDQRSETGAVFYIPSALWHACVDAVSKKSSIAWWFLVFFIFYDGSHSLLLESLSEAQTVLSFHVFRERCISLWYQMADSEHVH